MAETVMEWFDDVETFTVWSDNHAWINRLEKLAAEHPDEVIVKKHPEENDGCWLGKVPRKWVKIHPPRPVSEERRKASAERLRAYRQKSAEEDASAE